MPLPGMRTPWRFTDPVSSETYFMETNPKEDGGSHAIENQTLYEVSASTYKTTAATPVLVIDATVAPGIGKATETFSYTGTVYTEEQYVTLMEWFSKDHSWLLRDDLFREFLIYVESFTTERVRSANFPWKHTYTVSGLVLEEV